jgi:peptidoglycan/LPS O-acetylase OafA/YrhL
MFNKTVKELLQQWDNTAPGFDALRLCLASLILLWHCFFICYPETSSFFIQSWRHPFSHPVLKMILPMFFFLSGFLVSTSAYRVRSTGLFLLYRVFRILPALLVELSISAVLLGGIMTTLSIKEYYSSWGFWGYFQNIWGNVQFLLPGVFENHPCKMVNANLWTLPAEFYCYALMAVLMVTRVLFNRKVLLGVFLLFSGWVAYLLAHAWTWGDSGLVFVRPPLMVVSFLLGVFTFVFSDKIVISKPLLLVSIAGLLFFNYRYTIILGVIFSCYLCLCIGFLDLRKFPLVKRGDYSYGVYLYSFPIQQTLWHVFPFAREWWTLFLIALPTTLAFSMLSWRWVELPFLKLKRHLKLSP